MDFTCAAYDRLLCVAREAGYRVLPIREALTGTPAAPALILRHDVEWNFNRTLAITQLEQKHGVRSSLYFRVDTGVFDPAAMRRLQDDGFEIGYHFNTLDRCRGDLTCAIAMFADELQRLREAGLDVVTAIPHGDPRITRIGYQSNADIFDCDPDLLNRVGLLDVGNGLSDRYLRYIYITDLGIRWNGIGSTAELLAGFRARRWPSVYMLTHPDYWSASPLRAMGLQIASRSMSAMKVNRVIASLRSVVDRNS